ncbi:hydroxymethylbilane synthase [Rothia sp. P13129]|uniref:hydroxymethylbilane synthase n=1 Tax=Rothia sp. P13129 TaxID=3402664 RepID=UPI003AD66818
MGYTVGTRGSALALTQTGMVADAIGRICNQNIERVTVKTEGDILTGPLSQMGGTGVFAATLRQRVLDGSVDMAVHSLKDLPTQPCPGLNIAAIPEREDPRDALCARDGLTLETLPEGAKVGTGSPRRAAQIKALRPDINIVDIRGNVGTRLARVPGLEHYGNAEAVGDCDAVILAAAGLHRLGYESAISEYLDVSRVLPAPGQGALAVEIREQDVHNNTELAQAVVTVDHLPTRYAVIAERAVLRRLEAGCASPIGTYARYEQDQLILDAVVASADGSQVLRHHAATVLLSQEAAEQLGIQVAEDLLQMGADRLNGLNS